MVARRGFIIAIENYTQMQQSLAPTLPGTHQAAADFRNWLINEQRLSPSDIYYCTENATIPTRTAGADRDDIVNELVRMVKEGKDKTDELYFLYSGHGFCYTDIDGARVADIMLAANYRNYGSGNACLKINEIQRWLRVCMGPKDHFYFIDACRNDVSEKDIKVGNLGQPYDMSKLGTPTVYTLYSTVEGAQVTVNSGFIKVLLAGLKGTGRAKVWRSKNMAVLFRSVKDYVASKLTGQGIDERKEGSRDGIIREITPPPTFKCEIDVQNAGPTDQFKLTVTNERNQQISKMAFAGPKKIFSSTPDDYNLTITTPNFVVAPIDPLPADLYEDCNVRFIKKSPIFSSALSGGGPSTRGPGAVDVTVRAPLHAKVIVRNLDDGKEFDGSGTFVNKLAAGRYLFKTADNRGVIVDRRTINVTGPAPMEIDLSTFEWSPLRDALLTGTGREHGGGAIVLSESIGPTPDQGLDLWLALIGASRIVSSKSDDFSKLSPLSLASFHKAQADASPIYFLAGFDRQPARVAVGVSDGPKVTLEGLNSHRTFPGLFELLNPSTTPGYHLMSVQVDEKATITFGACTLPNRATLITLSVDKREALVVQQFILPIGHLSDRLPNPGKELFLSDDNDSALKSVRRLVDIQRQFAQSKTLLDIIPEKQFNELLYMKWFEPIAALLSAYELARRGSIGLLKEVAGNLRQYFPLLPDTEAIAKMADLPSHMPEHPPLLLDGLLTLNMPPKLLPLPLETLDFRGPWAVWKGAIV